ncbi:hypothetical protein JKP88DRAFT_261032 [Tribonema minus]|uniref:Smr domain-containing protein n=1 Tax=Tribonema minus TaxID=303371 RepID=A0A835YWM4_9STRA|nr:hypothetical protein JKP88DRAFT_261032 [Tribonema minus]
MAYNHQPQHAMTALRQLQGSGAVAFHDYQLAIHAYAKELPFEALELLHETEREGLAWTHRACSTTLQAFGKAGRLNAALQLIGEMEQRGISPDHIDYLTLTGACARGNTRGNNVIRAGDRGGSEQVLEILRRMQDKGPVPDIRHYSAAMKVCMTEGNSAKAVNIFRSMRDQHVMRGVLQWVMSVLIDAPFCIVLQGIKPDVRSWNVLLNAIGRTGQVAAGELGIAEGIWSEMLEHQLAPDVKTYNALIMCYTTAKQPDKAEEVLAEMIQSAAVKPDAIMFTSAIGTLIRACADFRTVLSTMRPALLLVHPPRMISVMQAYINAERLDDAEGVISRMRAAGAEPILSTWTALIIAADAVGNIKKADLLYCDALSSKAINPCRPERSHSIRDSAGNTLPVGTVIDLHRLNRATGQAAVRHELRVRQKAAGSLRRGKPLYIITGQGEGLLLAAVSDTLKSQGIRHVSHAAQPGIIYCTF